MPSFVQFYSVTPLSGGGEKPKRPQLSTICSKNPCRSGRFQILLKSFLHSDFSEQLMGDADLLRNVSTTTVTMCQEIRGPPR